MCVNVEFILPVIQKFMFVYSLQCGSHLIFLCTLLRSIFCIVFTTTVILEILIKESFPLGPWLVARKLETDDVYLLYYIHVVLLLCESVLLVFTIHLVVGITRHKPHLLKHYLICRFMTWLTEVACLVTLCVIHELLIGWYLGILFFVVLEIYFFIVVYSNYVKLREDQKIPL
ncbi:uncharacterized protein LOC128198879 [Bicyclus anynana]|uniref:Uncharacterized protein LOC128198879 n=1 Tax=Bicyclus anynana TaxID=110368 RepID=A0ABM3LTE3_BICAN|nr:uncharacterized protein LOC128198879 [Bicyclus anynana]